MAPIPGPLVGAAPPGAGALGLPPAAVSEALAEYRKRLDERLKRRGPPRERHLLLEPGLPDAEKVARAVGFLRPLLG